MSPLSPAPSVSVGTLPFALFLRSKRPLWTSTLLPSCRRGNPLHLCSERYQKIERLWHQHGIAEVIGHAQEANQTLVTIDWQHL